jgi:hypothetical protein
LYLALDIKPVLSTITTTATSNMWYGKKIPKTFVCTKLVLNFYIKMQVKKSITNISK